MTGAPSRSPIPPAVVVAAIATLALGLIVLGAGFLNSGFVRNAGWPHALADIEGTWVLDRVRGEFDAPPPETLVFSAGSAAGLVRMSDGARTTEFEIGGVGHLTFAAGQRFEPLLRAGRAETDVMTHLCPPLPGWDHLNFYPDGPPIGHDADRRTVRYERE